MIPLADNPKVVIRLDESGQVSDVSTNISPQVELIIVHGKDEQPQAYPVKFSKPEPAHSCECGHCH